MFKKTLDMLSGELDIGANGDIKGTAATYRIMGCCIFVMISELPDLIPTFSFPEQQNLQLHLFQFFVICILVFDPSK